MDAFIVKMMAGCDSNTELMADEFREWESGYFSHLMGKIQEMCLMDGEVGDLARLADIGLSNVLLCLERRGMDAEGDE